MNNFALMLPEIIVAAVGFGVLTVDFFLPYPMAGHHHTSTGQGNL